MASISTLITTIGAHGRLAAGSHYMKPSRTTQTYISALRGVAPTQPLCQPRVQVIIRGSPVAPQRPQELILEYLDHMLCLKIR